uniref:DUF7516 domain-containing protein n=1 Tax=Panagrellus redivivus TaxID=6233 RepID=A0A7E4VKW1_PANRE
MKHEAAPSTTNSMSSSPGIDTSSTPSSTSLEEAMLAFFQSCKLAKLTKEHPVMWKDVQQAYKAEKNANLDDKELERLFSTSNREAIISNIFPCLNLNDTSAGDQITLHPDFDWDGSVITKKVIEPQPEAPPKSYVAVAGDASFENTMLSPNLINFDVEDIAQRSICPVRKVIKFHSHDHLIKTRNQLNVNYEALVDKLKTIVEEHKKNETSRSEESLFDVKSDTKKDAYFESVQKFVKDVADVRADDKAFLSEQSQWFSC